MYRLGKGIYDYVSPLIVGAMTGLAFGVLIFGCVITLAAAVAFRKFKAPAPSPTEK